MKIASPPLTLLIIFAFLWGCSHIYPTYQPSTLSPDLIEVMRESYGQIQSVRGIGRIEVVSRGKIIRTRQFIVLAKPDMIRADLLNFLDLPYFRLAFQGEAFQAIDMRENVFYTGEVAKGVSIFVPLRLSSREFIASILGELPDQSHVLARYDPHRRLYELTFAASARWERETFWIHPKTLKVVEVSKTDALRGGVVRISFSQFRKIGSVSFPMEIQIEEAGANNRIRFNFRKIEINIPLSRELFELSVPPGVEIVEIDERMRLYAPTLPAPDHRRD